MIPIKTEEEIKVMQEGGKRLGKIKKILKEKILPGVSFEEVEKLAQRLIKEAGGLVDDKIVLQIVSEHLKGKEHEAGVVIDGFPRSLEQAKNFKFPLDRVVYLSVSDKVNKERLIRRGRKDDTPELIEKRLRVYHQETEPILDFYRKKGLLLEVDGERPILRIFEDIKSRLSK